jgi:hypothetical protein
MNEAWKRGYQWAGDLGPVADHTCEEAMEHYGYDLDSTEGGQFMRGVEVGQEELAEGIYDGE